MNIDVEKTNEQIAFIGTVIKGILDFFQNLIAYFKTAAKGLKETYNYEVSATAGAYDNLGE